MSNKISVKFKDFYKIKHNVFTKVYAGFLVHDGRNTHFFLKIFVVLGLMIFRWFAFIALKLGLRFPTTGLIEDKSFPVRSTNSQFCSIYFSKCEKFYESDVHGSIQALLPMDGVFVDVGSNWGHHTFIAAASKNATVYAFEPNPNVADDIRKINDALGFGHVRLFNYALGSSEGSLTLKQNYFESGVASVNAEYSKSRLFASKISFYLHKFTFNRPISWSV